MNRSDHPTPLRACFERLQAGDAAARDELLRLSYDRLLAMTRKMLTNYDRLRHWEESTDVVQQVMYRLNDCLKQDLIHSPTDYFRLAATHIRRILIDLTRHYFGPLGIGTNHAAPNGFSPFEQLNGVLASDRDDPARLAVVAELHEFIAALPAELREVVELHWYLGMTLAETAAVLGLSVSTVKRRYAEALKLLGQRFGPSFDAPY